MILDGPEALEQFELLLQLLSKRGLKAQLTEQR
jgi:hypothetical protein